MVNFIDSSIVYGFQERESTIDFDGHISLVLFTSGCNFRCGYCHNAALIEKASKTLSYGELDKIFAHAKNHWVDAICITGGEPTLYPNLKELILFIKSYGFLVKLDTQGSFPGHFKEVLPFVDYVAMDYKVNKDNYSSLIGVPHDMKAIFESLSLLKNSSVDYEIRTTVITSLHTPEVIKKICSEIGDVKKFVLQRFVPRNFLLDIKLRSEPKTTMPYVDSLREICKKYIPNTIVR